MEKRWKHIDIFYPAMRTYDSILFVVEFLLFWIWLAFTVWAGHLDWDLFFRAFLLETHLITPVVVNYVADVEDKMPHEKDVMTTRPVEIGLIIVSLQGVVEISRACAPSLQASGNDSVATLIYMWSVFGKVYFLMSILYFIYLVAVYFAVKRFIKKNKEINLDWWRGSD